MDIPGTIVAMVHDRVGEALGALLKNPALTADLVAGKGPFVIRPTQTLLGQLEDPAVTVPRVSAGFVGDIAISSVSAVVNRLRAVTGLGAPGGIKVPDLGEALAQLRNALRGQLPFLSQPAAATLPGGVIENLVGLLDRDPQDIAGAAKAFQDRVNTVLKGLVRPGAGADGDASVGRLRQILGNDIGTVMPLAAIASAMQGLQHAADVPHSIEQGLLAYFFSVQGYEAVDGERVIAPVHLSDLKSIAAGALDVGHGPAVSVNPASVKQLKGLFTTATAEQYLRDTIRIIVESAYDALRGFGPAAGPGRYGDVTAKLRARKAAPADPQAIVDKFVTWFRGFSSMAESAAMRAVEVGTQGVSEFQTNPLIAAAAGAFAGTVARKLGQDTFLSVLSSELAG